MSLRIRTSSPGAALGGGIERLQVATDHQADHAVVVDLGLSQRPDHRAVAQRDDAVGALLDFVEAMGDEDDADAARLQFGDDLEQTVGLGQRQARGRLVHDDDLGAQRQRLGDLDQLALRQRQIGHQRVGLEVGAEPVEQRLGARADRGGVDQVQWSERTRLAAEEDIGGDVEIVEQVQFLVDEGDAAADRLGDGEIVFLLAAKPDRCRRSAR